MKMHTKDQGGDGKNLGGSMELGRWCMSGCMMAGDMFRKDIERHSPVHVVAQ